MPFKDMIRLNVIVDMPFVQWYYVYLVMHDIVCSASLAVLENGKEKICHPYIFLYFPMIQKIICRKRCAGVSSMDNEIPINAHSNFMLLLYVYGIVLMPVNATELQFTLESFEE